MKHRKQKFVCALLAALLFLPLLSGCGGTGSGESDTTGNGTVTGSETSATISSDEPIRFSVEELSTYTLIRSEDADEETITAASKLYFSLNSTYSIRMAFETDYVGRNEKVPVGTKEILIGMTNRPESVGVRWSDYRIAVENDRIVIGGGSGSAVTEAVDWFLENCVEDDGVKVPVRYATNRSYRMEALTIGGIPLKDYTVAGVSDSKDDDDLRAWLGQNVGILNVSDRNIRLTRDESLSVAELSATMSGENLILSVSTKLSDFSKIVNRFTALVEETAKAGKTEIVLFGRETMTLGSQYRQLTEADMLALEQDKADRIGEIRNTPNMTIPSGAKVYYVSCSEGNDSNNGTSPQTPWKTLAKVNSANLPRNSYVCFKRGDLWRENLTAQPGVTYTAYGAGDKPIFCGSPFDGAKASYWETTDAPNVWRWVGPEFPDGNVGTMVFNEGEAYAVKTTVRVEKTGNSIFYFSLTTNDPFDGLYRNLYNDLYFYHDVDFTVLLKDGSTYTHTGTGALYLYSAQNPGSRFRSIEFNVGKKNLVDVRSNDTVTVDNVTVDNLCLKYSGTNGVGANGNVTPVTNLRVQNCEIGWIGGVAQVSHLGRNYQTRFGNAISIYGACDGYTVENNYIYQVYDSGMSVQANYYNVSASIRNQLYMKDVKYRNNVIERCEMPIEDWMSDIEENNPSRYEHVLIEGNQIWYAGYGLCESRPIIDRGWSAAIKNRCNATGNRAYDYQIRNNLIAMWKIRAVQCTSNLFNPEDGSDSVARFSGNTYVGTYGKKFGQVEVITGENRDRADADFNFDTAQYMTEHEDTKRGAYLRDHSDGTDRFWIAP